MGDATVKLEYARFDPFHVEHYEKDTDTLYLDKKLEGTDTEKLIIAQHNNPSFLRDFEIFYAVIFQFKPLFFFNAVFPYTYFHAPKKHFFKTDPLKLLLCIIYIALMVFFLSRERVVCVQDDPNFAATISCYSCRPLMGCAKLDAEATREILYEEILYGVNKGILDYFANETAKNS